MGHLIPGGTGFHLHNNIKLVQLGEPIAEEEMVDVEEAKKEMLADYKLQANQALANVTVDWKHGRYILVKTTKCSVSADVVEFTGNGLVSY